MDLNDTIIEITPSSENDYCSYGSFSEITGNHGRHF